ATPPSSYHLSLHDALPIYPRCPATLWSRAMQQWLFAYSTHDNSINCHTIDSFTHPDLVYRRPDFIGDAMFFTDHREYVVTESIRSEEHTSELQSREKLVCR